MFVGYGQMEAGFPAFARQVGRGLDRGDRVRLRRQHRRHRRRCSSSCCGRISGKRRTRVLHGHVGPVGAWPGWCWARPGSCPARSAASAGVLLFHAPVRPRRDDAAADRPGDHQRPGARPPARPLQRHQRRRVPGAARSSARSWPAFMLSHRAGRAAYIAMLVGGCGVMVWLALRLERRITAVGQRARGRPATPRSIAGPTHRRPTTGASRRPAARPRRSAQRTGRSPTGLTTTDRARAPRARRRC